MAAEELLAVRLQLLKRKLDELEAQAATFAPAVHGHTIPQVAGLPEALSDLEDLIESGGALGGAIGFSITAAGNLQCGYAGAAPSVSIDAEGHLQLEV